MARRSPIMEKVRAEADAAEAENPDEDEAEGEGEPEPDPDADEAADDDAAEPEAQAEPLSAEAVQERLEFTHKIYAESLETIFAEAWADMHDCPLCSALGYVADAGPVMKPNVELCPDCNGHGFQTTPSLVPEHIAETCLTCSGNGWRTQAVPFEPTPVYNGAPATAANTPPMVPPMPVYDPTTNQWRDQFGNVLVGATG